MATVGRLLILIGCLATLPLIAWNLYLDRKRRALSSVRVLMWIGFGIFMGATASRNAIGLGWLSPGVEVVAIVAQLFGLSMILYGFTLTGLAARGDHA